jgi:phasin family protein
MTTRSRAAAPKAEDLAAQAKETVETVMKASQEATQKGYEQAMAMTREHMEKANRQLFQGFDEMTKLQKENVDAFVQASTVVARAFEDMGKAYMAYAQAAADMSLATGKAMLGAKTLHEVVDLQNEFAKTSFDSLLAETTKLSELSLKAANEAMEPIQARVNVAMEKIAKPLAA